MVLSLVFPENSRPPIHRRREFSVLRPFWWCNSHRGKFSSTTLFWTQSRLRLSWWDTGTIFYLTCIGHSRLKHISICCVLGCFNSTHFSPIAFRPLRAPLRLLTDSRPFESHDVNFESFGRPSFPSSFIAQLSNVLTPTCESYVLRNLISLGICKCRRFFFLELFFSFSNFFSVSNNSKSRIRPNSQR